MVRNLFDLALRLPLHDMWQHFWTTLYRRTLHMYYFLWFAYVDRHASVCNTLTRSFSTSITREKTSCFYLPTRFFAVLWLRNRNRRNNQSINLHYYICHWRLPFCSGLSYLGHQGMSQKQTTLYWQHLQMYSVLRN